MHLGPAFWRKHLPFPVILGALIVLIFVIAHTPGSGQINAADQLGAATRHRATVATSAQPVQDMVGLRQEIALRQSLLQVAAIAEQSRDAEHRKDVLQQLREAAGDRAQLRAASPAAPVAPSYPPSASGQAARAVAFATAQIGCPYVWGGTGPCQSGYDCSGLVYAAWAYAGVAIPRTSESQWAGLPHVPMSQIQPGDLIVFDGAGHVGMYVGGGMIIDAPQPGMTVEKIPLSTPWYQQLLVGAVRP